MYWLVLKLDIKTCDAALIFLYKKKTCIFITESYSIPIPISQIQDQ